MDDNSFKKDLSYNIKSHNSNNNLENDSNDNNKDNIYTKKKSLIMKNNENEQKLFILKNANDNNEKKNDFKINKDNVNIEITNSEGNNNENNGEIKNIN